MKDLRCWTVPCIINDVNIGRAMIDFGFSINLMPLSYLKKIKGLVLKPGNVSLIVADGSVKKPVGRVEDAIVRIKQLEFLVDFTVVDMENEGRIPLILGRPFMSTSKMVMRIQDGKMMLRDQEHVLLYNGSDKIRIRNILQRKKAQIVNKLEEGGTVKIRRLYSKAIRRVDRKQLMSWVDEDPNRNEKT
ncbi:uncharacterized protein LOC106780039 [Vigna radiata var. radiata]|uniref:Uncharacterized protein LOC106780039 n=1 Tax=Vigna radiata var. radiata TaxID=3916 RepID=A0A1S3W0E8_VIGRR|nr:uncharacterized protein LOC106780039 [Vigna radiata var. radiata]